MKKSISQIPVSQIILCWNSTDIYDTSTVNNIIKWKLNIPLFKTMETTLKNRILLVLVLLKLANSIDKNAIWYECQYFLHIILTDISKCSGWGHSPLPLHPRWRKETSSFPVFSKTGKKKALTPPPLLPPPQKKKLYGKNQRVGKNLNMRNLLSI